MLFIFIVFGIVSFQKIDRWNSSKTHQNFILLSSYHGTSQDGKVSAEVSNAVVRPNGSIYVTITNHSGENLEIVQPFGRLEKSIDGQWYYAPSDEKETLEREQLIKAGSQIQLKIDFTAYEEPGNHRMLYRFRGNWCSAEFEVL